MAEDHGEEVRARRGALEALDADVRAADVERRAAVERVRHDERVRRVWELCHVDLRAAEFVWSFELRKMVFVSSSLPAAVAGRLEATGPRHGASAGAASLRSAARSG